MLLAAPPKSRSSRRGPQLATALLPLLNSHPLLEPADAMGRLGGAPFVAAPSAAGIECALIGAMALAARGGVERAEPLDFAATRVRVAAAADLVFLELYAGGPSDLSDIERLLGGDYERSLVAAV